MLILPAIDLIGGKCVRLKQGDYAAETVYDLDPLSIARSFESQGARWLHLIDLDGAKKGVPENLGVLRTLAANTDLKIEFGGGIRNLAAASDALNAGADRVIIGTKVIQDPAIAKEFFDEFGDRVVASLDARNGFVAVAGWVETSAVPVLEAAKRVEDEGARRLIVTDIAKDGMLQGPNLQLLQDVLRTVEIPVIQSGGISSIKDVESLGALPSRPCEGVIIGKAIYERRIDLAEAIWTASTFK